MYKLYKTWMLSHLCNGKINFHSVKDEMYRSTRKHFIFHRMKIFALINSHYLYTNVDITLVISYLFLYHWVGSLGFTFHQTCFGLYTVCTDITRLLLQCFGLTNTESSKPIATTHEKKMEKLRKEFSFQSILRAHNFKKWKK